MYMGIDITEFERVIYGADPSLFKNKGIDDFLLTGVVGEERPFYQCASDSAADFMVKKAIELVPDRFANVLEPSSGRGKILRRLVEYYDTVNFFEINEMFVSDYVANIDKFGSLFRLGDDFLSNKISGFRADLIVMNPPHSFGLYVEHIRRAIGYLDFNNGGKIVFMYPSNAEKLLIKNRWFIEEVLRNSNLFEVGGGCISHNCKVGVFSVKNKLN